MREQLTRAVLLLPCRALGKSPHFTHLYPRNDRPKRFLCAPMWKESKHRKDQIIQAFSCATACSVLKISAALCNSYWKKIQISVSCVICLKNQTSSYAAHRCKRVTREAISQYCLTLPYISSSGCWSCSFLNYFNSSHQNSWEVSAEWMTGTSVGVRRRIISQKLLPYE